MNRFVTSLFLLLFSLSIVSTQAQTTASGETEQMMGFARAVEVAGGSVVIGEPANVHQPGMVYIYQNTDGNWTQQFRLSASDGRVGDGFGSALTVGGNHLMVGAPNHSDGLGAVYLFNSMDDGSWTESARITPADTLEGTRFGTSIVMQEDIAFIGAPREQDGRGAVYAYRQNEEGTWTRLARIANPDTSRGTRFGSALAADGNRLVVGAPRREGGAVYVFSTADQMAWSLEATLASDWVDERDRFGSTVGIRGNQVFAGTPRQAARSGAVFVYSQDESTGKWHSQGRLIAFDGGPRYGFGSSMTFAGDDVWIGAPGAGGGKGALYRFQHGMDHNDWTGVSKLDGSGQEGNAQFAGTIAVDGDIAVAGLTGADYGAGKAAILERGGDSGTWSVSATVFGETNPVLKSITGNKVDCRNGTASRFGCNNVNLLSFLPVSEIGGDRGVRLNDIWGWTDPQTGKEYALVGRINGTSFVDVSDPNNPVYVANLPMTDNAQVSVWRDIKVYKDHAYVVADNAGEHGMQVVDLTDLRDFNGEPLTMEEVAHYDGIHSAHNVVINEDTGFAYVVGSSGGGNTCGGGLHMVNIQDPANPTFAGCFSDPSTGRSGTGYTHDAQCVTYHGPDKEYEGHEICIGANETAISFADVTDKENPKAISTVSYPDYGYVHQGWLTEDHRYFFSNDELDELTGNVDSTRTMVWDVTDLDDPQFVREYLFDNASSDHNLYIKDGIMYESNYVSGLQVVDVNDPEHPEKIGFFDTEPFGKDEPGFAGTWSNYPFFESDIVIMTSGREGLFILKKQNPKSN